MGSRVQGCFHRERGSLVVMVLLARAPGYDYPAALGFLVAAQGFIMAGCSFFSTLPMAGLFVAFASPPSITRSLPSPHHDTTMSGISGQAPSGTGEQNRIFFFFSRVGSVAESLSMGLKQSTCQLPPPRQWYQSPHLTWARLMGKFLF